MVLRHYSIYETFHLKKSDNFSDWGATLFLPGRPEMYHVLGTQGPFKAEDQPVLWRPYPRSQLFLPKLDKELDCLFMQDEAVEQK